MYLKTFLHNFSIKLSSPLFLWNVWNIILPSSLKSSMQRSSDLHRLGIMYVLCMWILKFRPFYIFVIATPTLTADATMTTYNLHLNKAFDPIKANPGNWSWNITNPHAVVVSDNDLTGDVVAGPHQVPLGLPLQPALHPVPVQGVAPQRLRERGPLHLHPPPARRRPAVWRAAVRALEPHTERPHHPHQRGQPSQWTQHFQVIIAYETERK